jgi:hypothetical protein
MAFREEEQDGYFMLISREGMLRALKERGK